MTSASSGAAASEYPSAANRPSISSESLTFIWQPYVSTYTLPFVVGVAVIRLEWRPVGRRVRKAGRQPSTPAGGAAPRGRPEIGRASCRERGESSVVGGGLKRNTY